MSKPTHTSVPAFIISREVLQKAHGEALMRIVLNRAGIHEFTQMEILAFRVLTAAGYLEEPEENS